MRGLLLDRDGVINENRDDYVTQPEQLQFLPVSLDALAEAALGTFAIAVVTNQSAVGRGYMTHQTLDAIHQRMLDHVWARGGHIDDILVCPHRPDDGCRCRKPRPGLLWEAARRLDLDLSLSYFVGDSATDVQAAFEAGCRPILVLTGHGLASRSELMRQGVDPDAYDIVPDLLTAVRLVSGAEVGMSDQLVERLAVPVA